MENPVSARPQPTPALPGAEFLRWYWLKGEMTVLARTLTLKSSGSKDLLARRIAVALDGHIFVEPIRPKSNTSEQPLEAWNEYCSRPADERGASSHRQKGLILRTGQAIRRTLRRLQRV